MLPGFNHNLRHGGQVYHVQTEDGGDRDPRIVTQLFLGGALLAVERWSYKELMESGVDGHELTEMVRVRMMAQHKSMLRSVTRGAFERPPAPPQPTPSSSRSEAPTLEVPVESLEPVRPRIYSDDELLDAIRAELERQAELEERTPTIEAPAPPLLGDSSGSSRS